MGSIAFIRHAQASFFSEDYDQLSEHGQRQAELLGKFWKVQNQPLTEVIVGPCRRHRQTAEIALAASQGAAHRPAIVEWPELDEHSVDQLVLEHRESLADEFSELVPLVEAYANASKKTDRARQFQRLFEAISYLWIAGQATRPGVEPWPDFQDRVNRRIGQILVASESSQNQRRHIAVFSSVGPISVAFQRAIRCSDQVAISTGWRLRNCSVTRMLFSKNRFTLDSFNSLAHLPNQNDWTYR